MLVQHFNPFSLVNKLLSGLAHIKNVSDHEFAIEANLFNFKNTTEHMHEAGCGHDSPLSELFYSCYVIGSMDSSTMAPACPIALVQSHTKSMHMVTSIYI